MAGVLDGGGAVDVGADEFTPAGERGRVAESHDVDLEAVAGAGELVAGGVLRGAVQGEGASPAGGLKQRGGLGDGVLARVLVPGLEVDDGNLSHHSRDVAGQLGGPLAVDAAVFAGFDD